MYSPGGESPFLCEGDLAAFIERQDSIVLKGWLEVKLPSDLTKPFQLFKLQCPHL